MLSVRERDAADIHFNVPRPVDAHVHVGSWERWGLGFYLEDLVDTMDEWNYDGAVVTPALVGPVLAANQSLQRLVRERTPAGRRLFFFPWLHVKTLMGSPVQEEADGLLAYFERNSREIHGLKYHAPITQMSIQAPPFAPFLEYAALRRLPILYHCGRNPLSWADRLQPIMNSYPEVPFIMAHLGGNAYDRIVETMETFKTAPPNLYVETSTARHPALLARAFAHYGRERMLFGTDLPFTDQRLNFDCLRYSGVVLDRDFMGGNLLRLMSNTR